ncbi:hypothetical protein Emtol_1868 [Emticicia oligotrophica DSM 17448]|uniref:Uncharacterized protein n=1 Tax=Emticicia oligotrophica (strain DSM 17448 / CIP 109782 / MTCC 6937 / GPTSA100-15) TaxID=929562 RepID=A0ABM5N0W7_EMTOG|nr:hypothetical protein [Emticicia oligotrophica]AFK03010.1 hypothetical protein Emtol_1868 [Emticicia oligotrophica DSM 17448]
MKNIFEEFIGLKVHAMIHYYNQNKLSISFENTNKYLVFHDCPLVFDSGIIGKIVKNLNDYKGEMSFVIVFREMNLDVDEYNFFLIKGDGGKEHFQNEIRIAYKTIEVESID